MLNPKPGLKYSDENDEITVDQESQFTNSPYFGRRNISIIRTISLPSYENATTCQKVETPPPKYLELFFPRKTSPPLDPVLEVWNKIVMP